MDTMTTAELRAKARELRNAGDEAFKNVTGIQIAGMLRNELIARMTGTWQPDIIDVQPEPKHENNNGGNGNGHGHNNDGGGTDADLINMLARALGNKLNVKAELDKVTVQEMIDARFDNSNFVTNNEINALKDAYEDRLVNMAKEITERLSNRKQEIVVTTPDLKKIEVGMQHEIFPKLLTLLSMKKHVFLVGPSGSGKTHIAHGLAKALDIPYKYMLVGPETSKSDFFGFRSMANGEYMSTDFYDAYVNGGLILIDELDKGNAGVMCMLNAALDNGFCAFPCGMKPMHENFRCIASANTYGRGADRLYCGSQPLDAATLQRFKILTMDYDKKLEYALCPDEKWTKKIHILREVVAEHKAKIIVSMRAVIEGYQLMQNGFSEAETLDMTVFQGYNNDAVSAIKKDWKTRC